MKILIIKSKFILLYLFIYLKKKKKKKKKKNRYLPAQVKKLAAGHRVPLRSVSRSSRPTFNASIL